MRRRSIHSTPIASSSSSLPGPANPRLHQTLARRIREFVAVLFALVLKSFWGFFVGRPGQTPNCGDATVPAKDDHSPLSVGDLDRLPTDVFMQILRLLGPKEAARSSLVCKSWKVLVSDNRVWVFFLNHGKEPFDTIVFAETHLKMGPMAYFDHSPQVSFMNIFAQRAMVPGSIIVDGGSGYCKFGWSKYDAPSGRCATFLEFGNLESPMHARLRHFYSTICNRMQVRTSSHPIIVSIPICHTEDTEADRVSRRGLKNAIYSVLFDMNAPAVCAIDQAVLSLYSARRTSGILVNIGFNVTSIVPILRGKVMHDVGIEVLALGALNLNGFLKEVMQQRNIIFQSAYTIQTIKEKLCYVAADYDAELSKDTKESCEVAGEGFFTLSRERFQAGEILFQPHIAGFHPMPHCLSHLPDCPHARSPPLLSLDRPLAAPQSHDRFSRDRRSISMPLNNSRSPLNNNRSPLNRAGRQSMYFSDDCFSRHLSTATGRLDLLLPTDPTPRSAPTTASPDASQQQSTASIYFSRRTQCHDLLR